MLFRSNQFNHSYKSFNWNVKWADPDNLSTFEAAISPRTKAIFIESIANPGGVICDIAAIAAIARRAKVPLIVDNTLATPYLCKPIEFGAVEEELLRAFGGDETITTKPSSKPEPESEPAAEEQSTPAVDETDEFADLEEKD